MLTIVLKCTTCTSTLRDLDRLLHPRVPPLVRAPSHMELLILSRTEESVEEQEIRESLHMDTAPPSSATETTSTQNQQPKLAPVPPSLPHRNPDTLPGADEFKVPGPALSQVSSSYPQATAPPSVEPAPPPSHGYNVASPARFPSLGNSDFNDTLHPSQAHEVPPSFLSEVVAASEALCLGAALEVINVKEYDDDDDDDDEEMPSIDMGSDSTEP